AQGGVQVEVGQEAPGAQDEAVQEAPVGPYDGAQDGTIEVAQAGAQDEAGVEAPVGAQDGVQEDAVDVAQGRARDGAGQEAPDPEPVPQPNIVEILAMRLKIQGYDLTGRLPAQIAAFRVGIEHPFGIGP